MTLEEFRQLQPGDVVIANTNGGWYDEPNYYTKGVSYIVIDKSKFSVSTIDDRGNKNGWGWANFDLVVRKLEDFI